MPLHEHWQARNAHFAQFFGWERPLYFNKQAEPELRFGKPDWFDQVAREVDYAHRQAAVFDQSSFGKIRVRGADAEAFLNRVCANDMTRAPGRAIYSAMLNERGGYESDLTALRIAQDEYRLYVGSSAIRRDMAWMQRHLKPAEQVEIHDQTDTWAVLALMGPKAAEIVAQLGAAELNQLGYFRFCDARIAGVDIQAVRLSYVGEAGWEISCASRDAGTLLDALLEAGASAAGIFAQTSMRIEKRFLAFGHDIDTDINPLQAGLDFTLDWNSDFIGRAALLEIREQPPRSQLASVVFDSAEAQPLGNEPVCHDGRIIGKTTSAAFGYRVGKPVAIALIERQDDLQLDGLEVDVDIARSQNAGTITLSAAWDPTGESMRPAQDKS
jgi:4-methylaminobutanoate oxidase (formaldehyde-forming)